MCMRPTATRSSYVTTVCVLFFLCLKMSPFPSIFEPEPLHVCRVRRNVSPPWGPYKRVLFFLEI